MRPKQAWPFIEFRNYLVKSYSLLISVPFKVVVTFRPRSNFPIFRYGVVYSCTIFRNVNHFGIIMSLTFVYAIFLRFDIFIEKGQQSGINLMT